MKILVLDDEPFVALNTKRMLEEHGIEVVGPALDAREALKLIEAAAPDAGLLDVNLGGGRDSFGVARALADRGVPFAFVTGYAEKVFPDAVAGRTRLTKPLTDAALSDLVARLRKGRSSAEGVE